MTQAVNLANFANNLDSSGGLNPAALNAATPISKGGTASTTASAARSALGLAIGTDVPSPTGTGASGTWAVNVSGTAAGLSVVNDIAHGGTNASTAASARTNLGLSIGSDVPSPSGTGASGTWGISISGNAATATAASSATTASSATIATTATNLASGSAGAIPYQSGSGATAMLAAGTIGQILTSNGTSAPSWSAAPIGVGQTWQDVTSSRTGNTLYTNGTSKPIMVCISIGTSGGTIVIDGVSVLTFVSANQNTPTSATVIVPAGSTYRYNGGGITIWSELR